jgi:hypothetical protein
VNRLAPVDVWCMRTDSAADTAMSGRDKGKPKPMTKVRMRIDIQGLFHNVDGIRRGDIVEIEDQAAERYCKLGYAQTDLKGELGPGYQPAA